MKLVRSLKFRQPEIWQPEMLRRVRGVGGRGVGRGVGRGRWISGSLKFGSLKMLRRVRGCKW